MMLPISTQEIHKTLILVQINLRYNGKLKYCSFISSYTTPHKTKKVLQIGLNCPGCTLPLNQWHLGYAPFHPRPWTHWSGYGKRMDGLFWGVQTKQTCHRFQISCVCVCNFLVTYFRKDLTFLYNTKKLIGLYKSMMSVPILRPLG